MLRDHHPPHDLTDHRLPHLHRFRIGFTVVHAPAHIGIEGEVEPADEALSRAGSRKLGGDQFKIRQLGHALGGELPERLFGGRKPRLPALFR